MTSTKSSISNVSSYWYIVNVYKCDAVMAIQWILMIDVR